MEFFTDKPTFIGNRVRGTCSDCCVTMKLVKSGGIPLKMISKAESMFGDDRKIEMQFDTY